MNTIISTPAQKVTARLRALVPHRRASFEEALRIAEQQALRFLSCLDISDGPVPTDALLSLPAIALEHVNDMPSTTSGCYFWNDEQATWIIQVNGNEPPLRQRLSAFHEYKHIIDHGHFADLYGTGADAGHRRERAAEYFAGCVLMPRPFVKRAWCAGLQTAEDIADQFQVSLPAATLRLKQLDLSIEADRYQIRCRRGGQGSPRPDWSGSRHSPQFVPLPQPSEGVR